MRYGRSAAVSGNAISRITLAALIACCVVLLAMLSGCGGDMMATTTQAQGSGQSASAAASDDASIKSVESASQPAASPDAFDVKVEFDCANAHAYNAKFPETLGSFTVKVEPDGTVFDALVATGVKYSLRGKNYVSSIGGIEEKTCGRDSGWLYLVNGKRPYKTAMEYKLEKGDSVRWAYTVTEGDVS